MSATFPAHARMPDSVAHAAAQRSMSLRAQPALAGTLAVCLGLAGGRWGSYLGRSPIYLTDVLFAAACLRFLWIRERGASSAHARGAAPTGILLTFAGWAFIRFVLNGRLDLVALRDWVPYAYALIGVLSGAAVVQSTPAARARAARMLTWALAFHAVWFFTVVVLWPGLPANLPTLSTTEGIHILTPRGDFDTAMVGVYAALLASAGFRRSGAWLRVAGIAMCLVAIGVSHSRAGLIGASIAIGAVVVTAARSGEISYRTRMAVAASTVFAIAALVVALPLTVPGQRALATIGLSSGYQGTKAVGTARAREHAWGAALGYSSSSPSRVVAGVGFGPDYMRDSGAIYQLTSNSDTRTRAPHSWWVDVQARLGVIGLALSVLLTLKVLRRVRVSANDRLLTIASLAILALIPTLSFGVIMESPFGAVPFYWFSGIVLSWGLVRRQAASHFNPSPEDSTAESRSLT